MNIHPHYGYNYDYSDYLIDLDKQVFVFTNSQLEIPLSDIQNASVEHIMYLMEDDYSLIKNDDIQPIVDNGLEEFLYSENEDKEISLSLANTTIKRIFSIPHDILTSFFEKRKQERDSYYQNIKPLINELINDDDNNCYSYSIYSTECSSATLRKVIFFLQESAKTNPFLLDCAEWGLDENYINGGLRFVSPKNNAQSKIFDTFIRVLENQFKLGFNIMSGAGFGLIDETDTSVNKSLFSFEELKDILSPDDYNVVMEKGLPYLAYHSNIEEAISFMIKQNGNTYSPVFWTFVSLVKQNKELFSLVYPQALEQMKSFEDSDVTRIKNIFLNSFYDGVQLNNLIPNNNTFIEYLTKTDLFKYCKEILSDSEKTKYLC